MQINVVSYQICEGCGSLKIRFHFQVFSSRGIGSRSYATFPKTKHKFNENIDYMNSSLSSRKGKIASWRVYHYLGFHADVRQASNTRRLLFYLLFSGCREEQKKSVSMFHFLRLLPNSLE